MRENTGQGWVNHPQPITTRFNVSRPETYISGRTRPKRFRNRKRRFQRQRRGRKQCPICKKLRKLIRYHISYRDNKIIMACRGCNNVEYRLRNGLSLYKGQKRIAQIIISKKFTYYRKKKKRSIFPYKKFREVITPFGSYIK